MAAKSPRTPVQVRPESIPDLEEILTSPDWFGIPELSPVQRAICRVIDGLPLGDLRDDPLVIAMLAADVSVDAWRALLWGSDAERAAAIDALDRSGVEAWEELVAEAPDGWRPQHVVMACGVRALKTLIAVAAGVRGACLCDMTPAEADRELPRASFLSLTRDLARVAYAKFARAVQNSSALRSMVVGDVTQTSTILERPDDQYTEFKIAAADEGGASLAARWISHAVLDEGPRFGGGECKVSYSDIVAVARERLLPGAQIFTPGAPWAAQGPVYDLVRQRGGKPGRDLVVLRAPSAALWPAYWTQERLAELESAARLDGTLDIYLASFWAVFIEDADTVLIPSSWVSAAMREGELYLRPAERPWPAVAAMDPATRGNAWTLTIVVRDPKQRLRVALARQWKPQTGQPLDPEVVLGEIAAECSRFGLDVVYSDQLAADWNVSLARKFGLVVVERTLQGVERYQAYQTLRGLLAPGKTALELPPDVVLANDLRRVRRKLTQTGVVPHLPITPDGRHCDYASALVLCAINLPSAWEPVQAIVPEHEREFDDEPDPLDRAVDLDALDHKRDRARFTTQH